MRVLMVLVLLMFAVSAHAIVVPDTVHTTVTSAVGYGASLDLGGDRTYESITCFISGTAGTMDVDIDGSLDGTTYYDLYDGITGLGGFTATGQPFNYYQVDVDVCSGTCSITIKCQPQGGSQ